MIDQKTHNRIARKIGRFVWCKQSSVSVYSLQAVEVSTGHQGSRPIFDEGQDIALRCRPWRHNILPGLTVDTIESSCRSDPKNPVAILEDGCHQGAGQRPSLLSERLESGWSFGNEIRLSIIHAYPKLTLSIFVERQNVVRGQTFAVRRIVLIPRERPIVSVISEQPVTDRGEPHGPVSRFHHRVDPLHGGAGMIAVVDRVTAYGVCIPVKCAQWASGYSPRDPEGSKFVFVNRKLISVPVQRNVERDPL